MSDTLLWNILFVAVVTALLGVVVAFVLRSWRGDRGASQEIRDELRAGREESRAAGKELREEVSGTLKSSTDTISKTLEAVAKTQQAQLEGMTAQLKEITESNQTALDRIRTTFDARVKELQEGNEKNLGGMRKEAADGLKTTSETLAKALEAMGKVQQTQLEGMTKQIKELTESNQTALDRIRTTFDARVKELQEGNEKKLDEMRKTVDEKLHDTLEKRLGESFKLVSDRLEAVHKGLGEMQTLATGVGDLKRVLTNVKARGTWAEVQLGALLEQVLTAEQYEKNVCVKAESSERVEYAVRLPGPKDDPGSNVWLPIDSKFPQEDYLRLQEAAEKADLAGVQVAVDALARTVNGAAKDIHDKYVNPPDTTDFGIMFLATEGLYAEVLRQPALVENLQQRYRVVVAGPTTLIAILSSLRMGFQTLAIEQRASEVWRVLGAVKTEFGKFGDVLDKVKKQLNTASRTIEQTGVRSRAIERQLRRVEQLPEAKASEMLALPDEAVLIGEDDLLDGYLDDSGTSSEERD
ncbi:DNA recombination protein RmuC [Desulfonatronum zhilinae]|nr:DNA recombination protein RmuC [Desulfonatronum zhilinae]